ncbi:trk system potassium uptake protein TrkH [Scopulibacillus darangshiensis]|uniref:Trk system potassium uptake protein TrkH n=1 Tax=Scopulibacillus darangshiensis TaxID=442528 RepID=A0A4R2P7L1_9BACL|nr:TrkH family potassium uptake protein [Scopulibacillus darangshiensis]TCP29815.1 trk system potassium uptake protein TrkH [Scopulibacillus darangshiensis]
MARKRSFNSAQILVLIFISFIILGTVLLKCPFSTKVSISWLDALFTSTSAMTVTGLNVVDPIHTYTILGTTIIMLLIQFGGLGIMTFAVLIYLLMGKRISIKQRLIIQEELNQSTLGGLIKLVKRLFIFSIFFEGFLGLLLSIRFIPDLGLEKGLYYSLFHAVSAFNNAGFSLWTNNLTGYVGDPIVNVVISALFIIGGIGFTVMNDIWEHKRWRQFSLHTKLMLLGTLIINIIAFIIILSLEHDNPGTLGTLHGTDKYWAAYFQAAAPRTAGFNSVDIGALKPPTLFFIMILMFIGAGSISTGGGIKLTTFISLLVIMFGYIRRKNEAVIMERTIPDSAIFKGLTVALLSIAIIFVAIFSLLMSERTFSFIQIAFEVVSAFGTVGLSTGITPDLSSFGQCVIAFMMIIGKLGPLTLVLSLTDRDKQRVRYPKGEIFIS